MKATEGKAEFLFLKEENVMKKRNRIIAAGMALTMLLLTACSGGKTETQPAVQTMETAAETAAETTPADVPEPETTERETTERETTEPETTKATEPEKPVYEVTVGPDGVKLSNDPTDFVLLSDAVPDAILEIRYFSTYNFVGEKIEGYEEPLAFLTKEAAAALKEVSDELVEKGYRLKIYDAYRPQEAVTHFSDWARDPDATDMKEYFYPELEKDVLFPQGYIAEHSGHSRGSTVDLTLFDMRTEKEVDMGGTFDYFGELSHPDYTDITEEQYANRMLLRDVMMAHGFEPVDTEWWHFTLKDEPFPDTYFTFPVNSDSLTGTGSEAANELQYAQAFLDEEVMLQAEQKDRVIQYLPDVTAEMTSPSFWHKSDAEADKILVTGDEVKALNESMLKTKACNMTDLRNKDGNVSAGISDRLYKDAESNFKTFLHGGFFDAHDLPVTSDMMDEAVANVKNKADNAAHPLQYGIAVHRTYLRLFPTDDLITDDLGDTNFDYVALASVRVNEPVVIEAHSADGDYMYALTSNCSGWIPSEDVAICSSKEEWLDAWDFPAEDTLVVTDCRIYLDESNTDPDVSDLMLTMGTWLESAEEVVGGSQLITDRSAQYNYVAYVPIRGEDGSYHKEVALIPMHYDISIGFLPLTRRNILKTAFKVLGEAYGWGGMLSTEDCSGYIRTVYRCFGLELPRNSSWQSQAPVKSWKLKGLSDEKKEQTLDEVPVGSTLFFEGHEMMYLGESDGKYYVISAVSSAESPYDTDGRKMRIRSVAINSLDMHRPNKTTWLSNLTEAAVPYEAE